MIPIAIVTEMEPEPAAVAPPITVFDAVITVSIAFLSLCRTLDPGESQQAETGRAREREILRTHGHSFLWAEGGCPALLVRTARERASVCTNIELSITNLRTRERMLSIRRVIAVLQNLPEDDQEALLIVSKLSEEAAR